VLSSHRQPSAEHLEDWQILKRTSLEGERVRLVPYTAEHVATYNKWLNDPYIQQMTQTEPYSLSQEMEYQKEWEVARNKYIFIILDRSLGDAMAGDINLFIQNEEEQSGELNIMIAEEQSRRKGLATESLRLILDFAAKHFELRHFVAKIQHDNAQSIRLFKKCGFEETEYVDAFKEYTFSLTLDEHGAAPSPNGPSKARADGASDANHFHTGHLCAKCNGSPSPKRSDAESKRKAQRKERKRNTLTETE